VARVRSVLAVAIQSRSKGFVHTQAMSQGSVDDSHTILDEAAFHLDVYLHLHLASYVCMALSISEGSSREDTPSTRTLLLSIMHIRHYIAGIHTLTFAT
jgi:hypothetical protein